MKAIVTGGSSGIGRSFVRILSEAGHEVTAVGRDREKLAAVMRETGCSAIAADLTNIQSCKNLFRMREDADILINCAGFGLSGEFRSIPLEKELAMIDLNIRALTALMKLYLPAMTERGAGYILNAASIAAFMPGPNMAGYFAGKSYVLKLSEAVAYELKKAGSNTYVGCVCPGPVDTAFWKKAGTRMLMNETTPDEVAGKALRGMFAGKRVIFTDPWLEVLCRLSKAAPSRLVMRAVDAMFPD